MPSFVFMLRGKINLSRILHMEPRPRKKGSYLLTLDDGRIIPVHEEVIVKYKLRSDMEVEDGSLQQWILEADTKMAYDQSLHYLQYRARSRKQMCDYLVRKGFGKEVIEAAADKLEGYHFLDDADYAARYIRDKKSGKPMGRRRMTQELKSKGISEEIAQTAVEGYPEEEEREQALRLGKTCAKRYRDLPAEEFRIKVGRTLQRRGFDWDTVRHVLRCLQEEEERQDRS
ncbi:MAG TPA: hypothetical protein DDW86_01915 [Clostridiales bacterium]|nr:hypothetical protein [Clostridiales bacterium]